MVWFPTLLARGRHTQYAVLPFKRSGKRLKICLLSSRETGRWIIPKGWSGAGVMAAKLAESEALEEACLCGTIDPASIGDYFCRKRLHVFFSVLCRVEIYPLEVDTKLSEWREQEWRECEWFMPKQATGSSMSLIWQS